PGPRAAPSTIATAVVDGARAPHNFRVGNPTCSTMAHKKPHLPTRLCAVCRRPFSWRKRWRNSWDAVRYCSERCRRAVAKST
ncbi:MAG: DUF2256 domain-containing protein, partial [Sedimenticolaceae bacterium]